MDPIPVFFENVRRTALIVKPKRPFADWLNSIDPADGLETIIPYSDVYLLPVFEDSEHAVRWLKKNFDEIFCDQMNHWYIDEDIWVQNRTFKMFTQWFDYYIHTTVWDIVDGEIEKY